MRQLLFAVLLLTGASVLVACQGCPRSEADWAVHDIDQETEFYEPIREATPPYNVRTAQGDKRVTQTPARQPAPASVRAPAARPAAPTPYASPPPVYRTPSAPTAPTAPQRYGSRVAPPPPPPPPTWPGDR